MVHSKGRVYRMHLTIYMEDGACSRDTDILEKWCIENCKDFVFQIEETKKKEATPLSNGYLS